VGYYFFDVDLCQDSFYALDTKKGGPSYEAPRNNNIKYNAPVTDFSGRPTGGNLRLLAASAGHGPAGPASNFHV
jgi:hypothetical protein